MTAKQNPRHDHRFFRHQAVLLSKIDLKTDKGLEIGVLDLPFITPDMGRVEYADHFTTEELKARAMQSHGHSSEFVQPVDYVLSQTSLETLPCDYNWVATAHLLEHVPDLIGWLITIGNRLLTGGVLFCVVPDSRYTFDIDRPLSTLGKIFQSHFDCWERPSFGEVFDAHYYSQSVCAADVWNGHVRPNPRFHNDFEIAWQRACLARHSYIDVHVNIFTPESLTEIFSVLSHHRFVPFNVEDIGQTEAGGIDFHVLLRKTGSAVATIDRCTAISGPPLSSADVFAGQDAHNPVYAQNVLHDHPKPDPTTMAAVGQRNHKESAMTLAEAFRKFETRPPSCQNAVEIFEGKWACDFGEACPRVKAGAAPLFTHDSRPRAAAELLGVNGRLEGMSVLELGPLEGAHTYQLERLGASSILSIEANTEAFLKCLITKEILELQRTRFMLGDLTKYLGTTRETFDLVFCSGVLYHMSDPMFVIEKIAKITQKCFVWTHYFDNANYSGPPREVRYDPRYPGVKLHTFEFGDEDMHTDHYWGGNKPISVWLERKDILNYFNCAGFSKVEIVEDTPHHPNGACFSFIARA